MTSKNEIDDDLFRVGNLFISRKALNAVRDSLVPLEKRSEMVSAKVTIPSVSTQGKNLRQTSFQITSMVSQARQRELVQEFKAQAQDKRNLQQTLQAMSPYVVVSTESDRALQQSALTRLMTSRRRRSMQEVSGLHHNISTGSEGRNLRKQPEFRNKTLNRETNSESEAQRDPITRVITKRGSNEPQEEEHNGEDGGKSSTKTIDFERISTLCPPDADLHSEQLKITRKQKALRSALTVQVGAPQMFSLLRDDLVKANGGSRLALNSKSALFNDKDGKQAAVTGKISSSGVVDYLDPRSYRREVVLCIRPRVGTIKTDFESVSLDQMRMTFGGTPGLTAIKESVWLPSLRKAFVICDWNCVTGHALAGSGGIWAGLGATAPGANAGGSGCEEAAAAVSSFIAQIAATAHSPFMRIGVQDSGNLSIAESSFDDQRRSLYWFRNCTVQPSSRQQMGRAIEAEKRIRETRESLNHLNASHSSNSSMIAPPLRDRMVNLRLRNSKMSNRVKNSIAVKSGLSLVLED